jgi:hypothetical protein
LRFTLISSFSTNLASLWDLHFCAHVDFATDIKSLWDFPLLTSFSQTIRSCIPPPNLHKNQSEAIFLVTIGFISNLPYFGA